MVSDAVAIAEYEKYHVKVEASKTGGCVCKAEAEQRVASKGGIERRQGERAVASGVLGTNGTPLPKSGEHVAKTAKRS